MKLLEGLAPEDGDRELALNLDPARIPSHIAIIMTATGDGRASRIAAGCGSQGRVSAVRSVVEDCAQLGVKALTLYAFSAENWKRPRHEVDMLWRLLRFYLRHELEGSQRNNIRLQSSGRVEALPERVYEELRAVERATAQKSGDAAESRHQLQRAAGTGDAVNGLIDEARIEGAFPIW